MGRPKKRQRSDVEAHDATLASATGIIPFTTSTRNNSFDRTSSFDAVRNNSFDAAPNGDLSGGLNSTHFEVSFGDPNTFSDFNFGGPYSQSSFDNSMGVASMISPPNSDYGLSGHQYRFIKSQTS